MQVHVGDEDTSVEATVGDSLVIALPENGTTGYQWNVSATGDAVVVDSDEFAPPESGAPGATGRRMVTLRATRPGNAVVTMRLERPWETLAAKRRRLAVTVRPSPAGSA